MKEVLAAEHTRAKAAAAAAVELPSILENTVGIDGPGNVRQKGDKYVKMAANLAPKKRQEMSQQLKNHNNKKTLENNTLKD